MYFIGFQVDKLFEIRVTDISDICHLLMNDGMQIKIDKS